LNSSNLTQLTQNAAGDFQPVFSPDGHRIAFMSNRDGDMEIFVMQADGTKERRLTNNATFDAQPTFSPNGQRIAFVSDRDGNDEIYTMNANGTNVRRLTNTPTSESRPNYSPDGGRIAFRTNRDGNGDIYVMNADGTRETPLTTDPALDVEPAFSPSLDGQQIVFRSNRVDVDGTTDADIYVMSADGPGEQTNLTIGLTGQSADRRPDWQPIPATP
jgi:TolB protein